MTADQPTAGDEQFLALFVAGEEAVAAGKAAVVVAFSVPLSNWANSRSA